MQTENDFPPHIVERAKALLAGSWCYVGSGKTQKLAFGASWDDAPPNTRIFCLRQAAAVYRETPMQRPAPAEKPKRKAKAA